MLCICGLAFYWLRFVYVVYDDERNEVNCREGNLLHCRLTKESDMVKIAYKYFYNPLHFLRNRKVNVTSCIINAFRFQSFVK